MHYKAVSIGSHHVESMSQPMGIDAVQPQAPQIWTSCAPEVAGYPVQGVLLVPLFSARA